MNKTRHYIRTLLLMLLLLAGGSIGNEAWAKKVTYHILTKPFTVRNYNNTGDKWSYIRVEALQCTSNESVVGLPDQFKSPLATNFQYWKTATPEYNYLYDYTNNDKVVSSKYYIYVCTADNDFACLSEKIEISEETPISTDADGIPSDIYVTYDYINDVPHGEYTEWKNNLLELNGGTDYNVTVNISDKQRFMCLNRSRNNRVANALASALSGEQLVDDNFVVPDNSGNKLGWSWGSWGPIGIHLGFKFIGEDPYNITIMTSYLGNEVHVSDAINGVDVTPYSSSNQNKATIKPYKESTLFGKIGNTSMWFDASNDRHYKVLSGCGQNDWKDGNKYDACKERYDGTLEQARYDTWVGFYRYETPTMNSYALLPNSNGGYLFVGSKMNQGDSKSKQPTIYQPNNNGQYALYYDNNNNPYFKFQAFSSAYKTNLYEIRSYKLHLTTHGPQKQTYTITIKWSDAMASDKIVDHIPEALKRKYCSYKAYSDEGLKNEITSFTDAINSAKDENEQLIGDRLDGKNIKIWLDYTVLESLPFKALPDNGNYKDAQWYTMRMDGVANPKYIAYNDGSNNLIVTDGSGNPKGSNTASQVHQGENSSEAMVAFMGDPYELRILNRKACEDAKENCFIGCATGSTLETTGLTTNQTGSSDISLWEIVYESIGEAGFLLRQFDTATSSNPKYIGLGSGPNNIPVTFSEKGSRIRVVELEKVNYTYHIMRRDGSIAVKATVSEYVGKPLKSWLDIPTIIRSPFLVNAIVNYYAEPENATSNDPNYKISNAPYDYVSNHDIYVRYDVTPSIESDLNVTLNAEYIYTSSGNDNIYSKGSLSGDDANADAYQWTLDYSDPYAMKIFNKGKNKYIKIASSPTDNAALGWGDKAAASLFIIKQSGDNTKFYEVMYAAGDDYDAGDGLGITTTYFNVGRNISSTTENTVKLYQNTTYITGYNQLRFRLIGTIAIDVTYHLIDMAKTDLLQVTTRHTSDEEPYFPPQYRSPLVSTYYYWPDETCTGNPLTEIQEHIYVTYDVNDLVDLKAGQLYLLKYEAGETFNQEDGSDGVNPTPQKAVYPYISGDCNFYVYGQEQYDLQQEGASSTRTRWAWYVESNVEGAPKGDPYHVTIKSRQTEQYPIVNYSDYNAYFMTYKPTDYSDVITTLGWPGMNSETATEYMVLGSEGQYQLVTTYPIAIDKNNNNTIDEGESERYVVDSFEQYWKTFDTIKKKIYGNSKEDDNDPIIIPNDAMKGDKTLRDYLKDDLGWHNYEKWAYAKRWNGYNNGYSSEEGTHETKKGWEKIEHWYQTINMGEGYFDFVKTDITPVLILLDQHGFEIMRKPLPTSTDDPQKDVKYAAIRPYNSPMIKEYAFWATAKKRTGLHQYYALSDRIGDDYTSTDLTKLPPYGSKNVKDKKGNQNDQYVTYIVKDEYAMTYNPANKEAKPFLIEQGTKYAAINNTSGVALAPKDLPSGGLQKYITEGYATNDEEKWYVKPNRNIDDEMGYGDVAHTWTDPDVQDPKKWKNKNPNAYDHYMFKDARVASYISDKVLTDSLGYFSFSNGFDPYNIQIESVGSSAKYMKTNADGAKLEEGSFVGSYPTVPGTIGMGDNATPFVEPESKPKWYDSRKLDVTNATFMAVQDAAGNMQLMPRFDHATRMSEFGTLIAPTDAAAANTYTKLYRPVVYDYRIIDNDGHESLRYKSGGDLLPQTPDHFRSPLAKNFKYYATADNTYKVFTDEITESLDGVSAKMQKENGMGIVYVRYEYDEDADNLNILMGNWLTMQLNNLNVYCKSSSLYGTNSYALTAIDAETYLKNQAKKLAEEGDYYFKVGSNYYKVTVTSIVDEKFATYDIDIESNSTNWDASTEKLTAADDYDLEYQAKRLTGENVDYYFKVGTSTYKKVHVKTAYEASYAKYNGPTLEANSSNWDASKPLVVNAGGKKWQWKFLKNQQSTPDPYAVYLFNRNEKDVELPNSSSRFAILSHKSGDYALAKAGVGTVLDYDYTYQFLKDNGQMSTGQAAEIATESGFTCSTNNVIGTNSQVKLTDEVQYAFTYKVYTNAGKFAIQADQTLEEAENNDWVTRIPDEIKTPLLNFDQFRYYGKDDYERMVEEEPDTIGKSLSHLYGLYDDEVVVRYTAYNPLVTEYQVPNARNTPGSTVAKDEIKSNDTALDISGKLPYNIIWYDDNMMRSHIIDEDGTGAVDVIRSSPNQTLAYSKPYEWIFDGNDPYAIKIKSVGASDNTTTKYIDSSCKLSDTPQTFMILDRYDHDYGVLTTTGDETKMLSGYGHEIAISTEPTKFIIFALSTHKVIYHLMIKNINEDIIIPYRGSDGSVKEETIKKGTTCRDLKTRDTSGGESGHIDGDMYQLGASLSAIMSKMKDDEGISSIASTGLWAKDLTYCYDAGHISLGDVLEVPEVFYRPNVDYKFFVGGIYNATGESEDETMNNIYKGKNLNEGHDKPLLGDDSGLLNKIVFINIVYYFMGGLDTNSGSDFVEKVDDNMWYTFEANGATPRLAEYTGILQTVSGYDTHYTNDYLWTPVGDPYGFVMHNRYMCKNLNQNTTVMTTESFDEGVYIKMAEPGSTITNENSLVVTITKGNEVYELLSSNTPGYFRVHPVKNKKTSISPNQYYIRDDKGVLKLSLTATEWTFGLSEDVMRPYYQAAGYVGGLNDAGKAAYDVEAKRTNPLERLMGIQGVVYSHDKADNDDDNYIVHYAPGYYRLHNQPGSEGISTPRYASGYTHKTELTAGESNTAIPMHFYEVEQYDINNPTFKDIEDIGTAGTDFTETNATRGDIPLVTVDKDPASIFYFDGAAAASPSSYMQTQGLYVKENKMTETETPEEATSFSIIDIGGGVIALQSGNKFLKYAQNEKKYDLKFDDNAATIESARWCMQPVQKTAEAGNGEMALTVTTNNGGDENYYTTFYAPFDVLLTNEKDEAFVLPMGVWPTIESLSTTPAPTIRPKKIGQYNTADNYCPEKYRGNDRFIPAGTPVIIRTKNTGGEITLALPTATPSASITDDLDLSGQYLEQMLALSSNDDYVFAFGRPYTHSNEFRYDKESGIVTPAGLEVDKGVGFYINASNNRESNATKTMWTRNNKYVYGNKIYRISQIPSVNPSRQTRSPEFIPVVFDDDEGEEDEPIEESLRQQVFNGCVYDLQGRCVATEEMVKDGTWRRNLKHGIYILNGKKVYVK